MSALLRLSEAFALAFHAMAALATKDGSLSVAELSAALGVSEAHLAKVMQRLARLGLLTSRRGPRGGFILAKPAGEITLLQVCEAVDGPLSSETCLLERKICPPGSCRFERLMGSIHDQVHAYLAQTKLSDITIYLDQCKGKGQE